MYLLRAHPCFTAMPGDSFRKLQPAFHFPYPFSIFHAQHDNRRTLCPGRILPFHPLQVETVFPQPQKNVPRSAFGYGKDARRFYPVAFCNGCRLFPYEIRFLFSAEKPHAERGVPSRPSGAAVVRIIPAYIIPSGSSNIRIRR